MPRAEPVQIIEGRWYAVAHSPPLTEECCSCGLVHIVQYKVENGRIWVRYNVDKVATKAARRRRTLSGEPTRGAA